MKKYLVEFISTFFLVFTIGMTVIAPDAGVHTPFAIAAVLMVLIYAGGHISGAHYNPAVTIAVWLRGKCPTPDIVPYLAAQFAGTGLASVAVKFLKTGLVTKAVALSGPMTPAVGPALLAEFLGTFALVWVILHVATAKGTSGNSYYGAAIAFTVLAFAISVGGISGGAFNPAVALGLCLMGVVAWGSLWIYLVACFAGAIAATYTFKATNGND